MPNFYIDGNQDFEAVVRSTKDDYVAAEEARNFALFLFHSATHPEADERFTLEFGAEGAMLLAASILQLTSGQIPTGNA